MQTKVENPVKAALSVSQQCRLLKMSRSQFYWHVKKGTFHAPLRLACNNRPYFTASMVEDNLRARETGINVNGEFVIFYERQPTEAVSVAKKIKGNHSSLISGLKSLGLPGVTLEQVEAAIAACFPTGTHGQEETEVLRVVFRHLKRSGVG